MSSRRLLALITLMACVVAVWMAGPVLAAGQRTFEYNERHQLVLVRDDGNSANDVSFAYDAYGNRTSKVQNGTTTTYRWNAQNRLSEVLRNGVWVARYRYTPDGRRIEKSLNTPDGGRKTLYQWEGRHVLRETNAIGNTFARYEWVGDLLVAMWRNGQWHYFQHDALGSPTRAISSDGAMVALYSYDAWGNPIRVYGTLENPHLFTGYPFDDETGLHYASARYYDSELGAFLSADPAGGDPTQPVTLHPYLYGRGNPLIYVDRDGQTAELQYVLTGFERNRQGLVAFADDLKTQKQNAGFVKRGAINLGIVLTSVVNVGNYVGEGVIYGANAGANTAISFTDTYIVDLGSGADPSNAEIEGLVDTAVPAARATAADPLGAAGRGAVAVVSPYIKAYEGDTRSQLDVIASLDPRKIGRRIYKAIAPSKPDFEIPEFRDPDPLISMEGGDGRIQMVETKQGAPVAPNPACFGEACSSNYKETFFEAHPDTRGAVVVHHAVEQQILDKHPGLVTAEEMHSIENLRGIPKEINSDLHLSKIRIEWNRFYKANPTPTKEQLLQKATEIDDKYGHQFDPPVRTPPED